MTSTSDDDYDDDEMEMILNEAKRLRQREMQRRQLRNTELKDVYQEKKRINRQQRLMDLMRHRTTVEQGITPMQIFKEIYYDLFEHYDKKVYHGMIDYLYDKKHRRITLTVKRLQKKDEFRWLSLVPCKDKTTSRIKEFRYVNIKPGEYGSSGYKLLDEVHDFWERIYHLRKHPEDITEEERQEARDAIVEQNGRIQSEITEIQKEREEDHKAIARIKRQKEIRRMRKSKRKLEKRLKRGQILGQTTLLDYQK